MLLTKLIYESPIGPLGLYARDDELVALTLPNGGDPEPAGAIAKRNPLLVLAVAQLREYFAGERRDFDLPLAPRGSGFQERVWRELLKIPFGETRSYGDVARSIGRPAASRAVGAANGRNPIAIIVPCHRVIGANGTLTGYGGGLPTKKWLLEHERKQLDLFSRAS